MRYTRERKCNPLAGLWSPAERHGFNKKCGYSFCFSKQTPEIRLKLADSDRPWKSFVALLGGLVFVLLQTPTETLGAAAPAKHAYANSNHHINPTMTLTPTPMPTWTPLPPMEYVVKNTDYCSSIAALFGVSVQSIIRENNLDANCTIKEGDVLKIPQPTPTPHHSLHPPQPRPLNRTAKRLRSQWKLAGH